MEETTAAATPVATATPYGRVLLAQAPNPAQAPQVALSDLEAVLTEGQRRRARRRVRLVELLAAGLSNAEIAKLENVQEESIKTRVCRMMQETGASNRAQLVSIGYETGMLRVERPTPSFAAARNRTMNRTGSAQAGPRA